MMQPIKQMNVVNVAIPPDIQAIRYRLEASHLTQQIDAQIAERDTSQFTKQHQQIVSLAAGMCALDRGLPLEDVTIVQAAARWHDAGKYRCPAAVFDTNRRLSDAERVAYCDNHALDGARLVLAAAEDATDTLATPATSDAVQRAAVLIGRHHDFRQIDHRRQHAPNTALKLARATQQLDMQLAQDPALAEEARYIAFLDGIDAFRRQYVRAEHRSNGYSEQDLDEPAIIARLVMKHLRIPETITIRTALHAAQLIRQAQQMIISSSNKSGLMLAETVPAPYTDARS